MGEKAIDAYRDHVIPNTVAIVYTLGWNGLPAETISPFHAYIRIGDLKYDYNLIGRRKGKGTTSRESYSKRLKDLLSNGKKTITIESFFWVPEASRNELINFFEDRNAEIARIDDRELVLGYDAEQGWGSLIDLENVNKVVLIEQCLTYALSWFQKHWWKKYPGLEPLVTSMGLDLSDFTDGLISIQSMSHIAMQAKPMGITVWGEDLYDSPFNPKHYSPHDLFLNTMYVVKHFALRLKGASVTTAPWLEGTQPFKANGLTTSPF